MQAGLYICHMPVSERPGHICGLAVAKEQSLADDFRIANEKEEYQTIHELNGVSICFPMVLPKKGTTHRKFLETLIEKTPSLFLELRLRHQLVLM